MATIGVTRALNQSQPSAVALVVHGLNYRPDRMQPAIDCLNRADVECISLSLHGHGDNYKRVPGQDAASARLDAYGHVTTDLWLDEVYAAYAIARTRASQLHAPLFFCGYSLGGLLGCLAMTEQAMLHFDGLLLFAPALSLDHYNLAMHLARWLPNLIVPSVSPTYYRANRASPAAAYLALFEGMQRLHDGDLQRMNVPTLVFIDERDELVSYRGVRSISIRLSNWRFHQIHKSAPVAGHTYHHLVIGNAAMGVSTWTRITEQISQLVHSQCDASQ